ncbi:hypothetical protein [Bacillus cereus]
MFTLLLVLIFVCFKVTCIALKLLAILLMLYIYIKKLQEM